MPFWTSIENQMRTDGSFGLLYDHYTSYEAALAKFYTVCAAAAVSSLPYHSAMLIQDDGRVVKSEIFDRRGEV